MSDKPSLPVHLAYKQPGDDLSSLRIEDNLFDIVHHAVGRIEPGASIKAQQNQAWLNLGRPKWWRFKSAWYRDGSGAWSAAAVLDFRARFQRFLDQEKARAVHAMVMERAARQVPQTDDVRLGRAEYEDLLSRISALEAALRL